MAKMIPEHYESDISNAEKKVFNRLKTDDGTKGWTVLHSMELARRGKKPYGEIDFVIIIPEEGVICLEVKGGGVSCKDGQWETVNRYGEVSTLKQSPFKQARESMFALQNSIIEKFGKNSREAQCPFRYAVAFPDVSQLPKTPEFEQWEIINSNDLKNISSAVMKIAREGLRQFQQSKVSPVPDKNEAAKIRDFLRPNFDLIIAKGAQIKDSEDSIIRLTEEQYERLDQLRDNPRCLFEGPAGTGKTMLALENSRRADKDGAKVLFVCFNRLLGKWIHEQTEGTNIEANTLHSIVRDRFIMNSSYADEFEKEESEAEERKTWENFFRLTYPYYGELALVEMGPQFDMLVMDEAQDLCDNQKLNLINLAIKGRLSGGNWAIFGDFSRQAIYSSDCENDDPIAKLKSVCDERLVHDKLTHNCRNTQRIAEATMLFSGFEKPPGLKLKVEQGCPVDCIYWKNQDEMFSLLEEKIKLMVKKEEPPVPVEDIMILSPNRLEKSALADKESVCGFPLEDVSSRDAKPKEKTVKFSTIHSFKGLESPVVIIVDVDEEIEGQDNRHQSLLYVGMSRAKSMLVLMVNEDRKSSTERKRKLVNHPGD